MTSPLAKLVAAAVLATTPGAAEPRTNTERIELNRGESSTVRSMRLRRMVGP